MLAPMPYLHQGHADTTAMLTPQPCSHHSHADTTAMLTPWPCSPHSHAHPMAMLTPQPCSHQSHAHPTAMLTPRPCSHQSHAHTRAMLTPQPCSHQSHAHPTAMLTPQPCSHQGHAHPTAMLTPGPCSHHSHADTTAMLTPQPCSPHSHAHTTAMLTPEPCSPHSHAHPMAMLTPQACSHQGHAHTTAMLTPNQFMHQSHAHTRLILTPQPSTLWVHPAPLSSLHPPSHPSDVSHSLPAAAVSAGRQRHGEPEIPDGAGAVLAHQDVLAAEVAMHHAGFVQPWGCGGVTGCGVAHQGPFGGWRGVSPSRHSSWCRNARPRARDRARRALPAHGETCWRRKCCREPWGGDMGGRRAPRGVRGVGDNAGTGVEVERCWRAAVVALHPQPCLAHPQGTAALHAQLAPLPPPPRASMPTRAPPPAPPFFHPPSPLPALTAG